VTPEHFTLHEVAGGVWAAQADFAGAAIGNAAIIDTGTHTIVVDTFMTDVAAQELREVAEGLTGRNVFLAVNSHWHGDHTNGNQVFSDVPIVATAATVEWMERTAPTDRGEWRRDVEQMLESFEEQAAAGDVAAQRRIGVGHIYLDFVENYRCTLPTLLIDDRLVVDGERTVEVLTYGRGHTVSDVFVWVPDERLVVAGDLVWNGLHPRMNDGFPEDWAGYVERLEGLDPVRIVPGHGPPAGREVLNGLPSYFRAIGDLVDEVRSGADPESIDPPASSEDWADRARFHRSLEALAGR
jgi:glyoxylase-like metal-dependent hydrolase (beta-lactamase superfamily II)